MQRLFFTAVLAGLAFGGSLAAQDLPAPAPAARPGNLELGADILAQGIAEEVLKDLGGKATDPATLGLGEDTVSNTELVVASAPGALLRGLDRVSGETQDLKLAPGQSARLGFLDVTLGECRYPADNPSGDAFAWVTVREHGQEAPIFQGWMIASSPALDALDHPRYDVWAIRCTTS